ncbi:MAG: dienelactone hydrolase family protein [Proteobacteria bacterium]|nr:dienelactone hydrolase family protein [Pseudomonadota bacterium]
MSEWIETKVAGSPMRNYVTGEPGSNGVLVCMHAPGIDESMQEIAGWLPDAGYQALIPDLYHRQPDDDASPLERLGRLKDDEIIADLASGVASLKARQAPQVAIIGFCMGGRLAYLYAAEDHSMKSAVVFYGGNIMVPWGHQGPSPYDRTPEIGCPILGLFGGQDTNPSPEDVIRISVALDKHSKVHEFHSYADAGHAFLNTMRPSYRKESGADAWQKAVAWLNQHFD